MKSLKSIFSFCAVLSFVIVFTSAREKVNYKIIPLLDLQNSKPYIAKTVGKTINAYLANCPGGALGCGPNPSVPCPSTAGGQPCVSIPPDFPRFTQRPCLFNPSVNACVNYTGGPVTTCDQLKQCPPRTSHYYPCDWYPETFGCRGGSFPGSPNCGDIDFSCPPPP